MQLTILSSLVGNFEERLNSFVRKFKKYGSGTITYTKSEPRVEKYTDSKTRRELYRNVVDINIEGGYKVGEWRFVASLEWNDEAERNIAKCLEGEEVPVKYLKSTKCEHCGTNRQRKHTVLLKNDDGEYKQVGKTCAKDFCGVNIADYAAFLAWFDSLAEYVEAINHDGFGNRQDRYYPLESILQTTCAWVRVYGYKSRSQAEESGGATTASIIYNILNEVTDKYGKPLYVAPSITDTDKSEAAAVLGFANTLPDDTTYHSNLKAVALNKYIKDGELGLAVSIVGYYLRKLHENEERVKKVPSEYVGNVGERITFTAKPNCIASYETEYGWVFVYKFVIDNNVIIWKTSKDLDESADIEFTATVKEHSEFRNEKQTVITRGRTKAIFNKNS